MGKLMDQRWKETWERTPSVNSSRWSQACLFGPMTLTPNVTTQKRQPDSQQRGFEVHIT